MNVLVIAAHPDDEVLGCGGTIARHTQEGDKVHILFVADGETARIMHLQENRNIAAKQAADILGASHQFLDHPDQRLDQLALLDLTREIEAVGKEIKPRIVYTHHYGDLNQDHRIVHKAVMTAFRPLPNSPVRAIYGFEVASSTEWGQRDFWPNHFVKITLDKKMAALACYHAEMRSPPHARGYDVVMMNAKMRGYSVGLHAAEAFVTMRTIR